MTQERYRLLFTRADIRVAEVISTAIPRIGESITALVPEEYERVSRVVDVIYIYALNQLDTVEISITSAA